MASFGSKTKRTRVRKHELHLENLESRQLLTCNPAVIGDVDGDGIFGTRDLIKVLGEGKYDKRLRATCEEGDFNGDGYFDSEDLLAAFGNYNGQAKSGAEAGTQAGLPRVTGRDFYQ